MEDGSIGCWAREVGGRQRRSRSRAMQWGRSGEGRGVRWEGYGRGLGCGEVALGSSTLKGILLLVLLLGPAGELGVEVAKAKLHARLIPFVSSLDALGNSLWISSVPKCALFGGGEGLLRVDEEPVEAGGQGYWR
jgi:hypothetical protein